MCRQSRSSGGLLHALPELPMWRTLCLTSLTKLYPKPRPVGSAAPASCSCALPSLQQGRKRCVCYGGRINEQQFGECMDASEQHTPKQHAASGT